MISFLLASQFTHTLSYGKVGSSRICITVRLSVCRCVSPCVEREKKMTWADTCKHTDRKREKERKRERERKKEDKHTGPLTAAAIDRSQSIASLSLLVQNLLRLFFCHCCHEPEKTGCLVFPPTLFSFSFSFSQSSDKSRPC